MDIPEKADDASDVIIYGVESEQIEEENDAYNDLRCEIGTKNEGHHTSFYLLRTGLHKDAEEEMDELMPSCFLLNMFDCFCIKLADCIKT